VTILKPNQVSSLNNFNVLIIYQPNATYKPVFEANKNLKINTWIVTGNDTDFGFLNQQQDQLQFKMSSQREDFLAEFSTDFNLFAADNIGFENFPPLENPYGSVTAKENLNVLLTSRIRNVETNAPLFAFQIIKANEMPFYWEKTSGNGARKVMLTKNRLSNLMCLLIKRFNFWHRMILKNR